MEGFLERRKKKMGIHTWSRIYAILRNNVLTLLNDHDRSVIGQIHMQIASFELMHDSSKPGFIINTGMKKEFFHSETKDAAFKWFSAMRLSKSSITTEASRFETLHAVCNSKQTITSKELQLLTGDSYISTLKEKVSFVCELQATLSYQLSHYLNAQTTVARETSDKLRTNVSEMVHMVEDIYLNQVMLKNYLLSLSKGRSDTSFLANTGKEDIILQPALQSALDDNTSMLDTARERLDESPPKEVREEKTDISSPEIANKKRDPLSAQKATSTASQTPVFSKHRHTPEPTAPTAISISTNPIVTKIITSNPVFLARPIPQNQPAIRHSLPHLHDAVTKLNLWKLIKNNIGKDLTKISLPVNMNEPISLTQKVFGILEFEDCMQKAIKTEDRFLRMAYILAMNFGNLFICAFSVKKPFNALLGETCDVVSENYRAVSEQVSHHPPVTAYYVESPEYEIDGNFTVSVNFAYTSMEILLKGPQIIYLKKTNERFSLTRPKGSAHNYVWGKPYSWLNSELVIENLETGEKAFVKFKSRTNHPEADYLVEGAVIDCKKEVKLKLFGQWNKELCAENPLTGQKTILVQKSPSIENEESQFYFSNFIVNLNNLTSSISQTIPPTDSRLRPDLRAFENGLEELAESEKRRLEDSQRVRAKKNQSNCAEFSPLWFKVTKNGKEIHTEYKRNYFQAKEKGEWPETLPLFI